MENKSLKETKQKITRERDRYLAIFYSMAEPAFVVDHSMRLITVNKAFERFFGTCKDEVKGKKCRDVINYDLCAACPLLPAMKARRSFSDVEASMILRGVEKNLIISGSFLDEGGSESPGGIVVIQDITGRKTAEQRLQLLHKAVSTSQAGITFRDTNNIIIFTNDAEARMHGYDKSELIGRPAHILSLPELRKDMDVEKMSSITGWERERISIRKDGTTFPAHLVSDVVKDDRGNTLGLVTICEDITQRKLTEENLKKALTKAEYEKAKTEAIIAAIAEGISIQDTNYRILFQNPMHREMAGDHIGEYCYAAYRGRESLCEGCHLEMSFRDGRVYKKEQHRETAEGKRYYEIIASPLRDPTGGIIAGIELVRDITERKKVEVLLSQHNSQQKAILNNISDIAWLKDSDSRFIAVNGPFAEACGMKPEEIVGKTDLDIWPEPLASGYRADDREVISSGRRKQVEELLEDTSGKQIWIETIKSPVYDEEGNIIGTTGIARDITERKKVEEELTLHKNRLEHLVKERTADFKTAINFLKEEIEFRKRTEETLRKNEAKMRHLHGMKVLGELAAGVAHEVRNPLHALMSVTEALKNELKDNPDFDIYLFHIRKQVDRLSLLMKDLLDLGKPIEPSHLREESLSEICMASIDLWKNSPSRKSHTISPVLPPSDKSIVIGDSQRLQQVFLNLLENAAYHSPEDSDIQVVISGPDIAENTVSVKVVDRGSGIPEERLPRIFEPFFTTRRGGTGLGLSIIKNILDGHDGRLTVRNNNPLPGCTAEVTLPLAIEAKS